MILKHLMKRFERKNAKAVLLGQLHGRKISVLIWSHITADKHAQNIRNCNAKINLSERKIRNLEEGKKFRISREEIEGQFAEGTENEPILQILEDIDAWGKIIECGDMKLCLIFFLTGEESKIKEYLNFYAALASHLASSIIRGSVEPRLYDIIINGIQDLFAIQDPEHTVLYTNLAAAKSVGKKLEELIGRKCYEIWHGRETPCEICPVRTAKMSKKFEDGIVSGKDGRVWYIRAYPILDSAGEIMAVMEITSELTDLVTLRKQFATVEKDYKAIIDNAVAGIYRSRLSDGLVVMANDAFARMVGCEKGEDVVGKFVASEHYVDISQRIEIINRAKSGKLPASAEIKMIGVDGKVRVLLVHARVVNVGNEEFFEGMAVDITEKKNLEETLTLSNRLLRISSDVSMAIASFSSADKFLNNVFVSFMKNGYDACLFFLKNEKNEIEVMKPIEKIGFLESLAHKLLDNEYARTVISQGKKIHMIRQHQGEEMRRFLAEMDLSEFVLLPIVDRGKIKGSLFLGYVGKNAFTSEEIEELEVIAGNIGFGLGAMRDREEKRRLEEALIENAERLKQISENITDVLCIINEKGVIEFITPSVTELTGLPVEKLVGKDVRELLKSQDYDIIRQESLKAMELMVPITIEVGLPSSHRGQVECEISIVPFAHRKREKKLIVSVRDISDRKQRERLTVEIEKLRIQSLMSTAIPMYFKDAPFSVYNVVMEKFGKRFEETYYADFCKFKDEMQGMSDITDITVYLMWLEKLLKQLGVNVKSRRVDGNLILEFLTCPWLEEAKNYPVMCGMCRGLVFRSASWVGDVLFHEQHKSIAGGEKTCMFEVEIRTEK
ncbi:MAG: PAS domain S-box protein [Thermoplasmata archaeon]